MQFKQVFFRKGKGATIPTQVGPMQTASLVRLSSVWKTGDEGNCLK